MTAVSLDGVRDIILVVTGPGTEYLMNHAPGEINILLLGKNWHELGTEATALRHALIGQLPAAMRLSVDWHACGDAERAAILAADALGGRPAVLALLDPGVVVFSGGIGEVRP